MRNCGELFGRRLRGSDVEVAVDLLRVGVDDLGVEAHGGFEGEDGFPRGSWACDDQEAWEALSPAGRGRHVIHFLMPSAVSTSLPSNSAPSVE